MEQQEAFTSRLKPWQTVLVLLYLPVHTVLLPMAAVPLLLGGVIDETRANVIIYVFGALLMLTLLFGFFRRDFDRLCDRPLLCLREIALDYVLLMLGTALAGLLISRMLGTGDNPNNDAVLQMADQSFGPVAAMTVFLAPIVEESIFRAGVFGALRRRSAWAAYLVSTLLFSAYHVWSYAVLDLKNLWYLLQYIPASLVLARCYERCDSIWGSILLHMLNNGVSMYALSLL